MDLLNDANSYLSLHLLFTYIFTFLALRFIHRNYSSFIRVRQLFSLELVHSIAGRTVLVTQIPRHLRGERALAVYFENMGLQVESVSLCRDVGGLEGLLRRRTEALLNLEKSWTDYLGNPSSVDVYDPSDNAIPPLIDLEEGSRDGQIRRGYGDNENRGTPSIVVPHRKRPTIRPGWFQPKTDALEYYEEEFKRADQAVQERRKTGKFKASHVAFVTFEKMSSAVSFGLILLHGVLVSPLPSSKLPLKLPMRQCHHSAKLCPPQNRATSYGIICRSLRMSRVPGS